MSSNERGVHQPQEEFASYEDYPEEETRSRLPLMIVIALVVLAAFAGVVWLAYNQGVAHGRAGAPPIVAAPAGPARTAPSETQTATGTATTPYTGLKVYGEPVPPDEEASGSALAPSPEPMPEIAVAPQPGAQPAPAPGVATAETPTRLAPEVTPAPAPTPQIVVAVPEATPAPAPARVTTTTTTTTRPHTPPATPAPSAVTHAPAPLAPVATNIPQPRIITPAPAPAPTPEPAPAPEAAPPVQVATATPPPAHTPSAASTHGDATATSGGAVLQVGSYPSDALAESAWKSFHAKHAGALSGLSRDVKAAAIPGKGTWYRLRVGPFASRAEANAKCAELKAAGVQCLVAAP